MKNKTNLTKHINKYIFFSIYTLKCDEIMMKINRCWKPVLWQILHKVCNKSHMMGATSGAGTAYHSRATEFNSGF